MVSPFDFYRDILLHGTVKVNRWARGGESFLSLFFALPLWCADIMVIVFKFLSSKLVFKFVVL